MTSFTWLPDAAWRGALLLAVAFLIARLLKPQPAAVRHVLWTGALAGVMAMPLLALIAPLSVPVTIPGRLARFSSSPMVENSLGGGGETRTVKREVMEERTRTEFSISTDPVPVTPAATLPWYERLSLAGWALLLWSIGALVLTARLLAGFVALRRMSTTGQPADDATEELADACAARLGVHAPPAIVVSSRVAMPCAAGWLRPVILLPDEYSTWSRERLEVVLLHELSHIRRLDIVPHLLSEIARVIYWFNPLVWLASARLRAEAEMATDDRVVHAGAKRSDYAAHLLEIVSQARPGWHPAPLMPLARRSEFEGRMLAILESGGNLPSARVALGTVVLIGGLTLGVASMEGAPATRGKDDIANDMSVVVPGNDQAQEAPDKLPASPVQMRQSSPAASARAADTPASALAEALRDPVASVRQAAAEALGNAKDSVAVRALMEVLRTDESVSVRRAAAWSLGEIGDPLAIAALSEALSRDRDVEVRKNAASALGNIENPRATPALMLAVEKDNDASVRMAAAESLSSLKDPSAVDALIRVIDRDNESSVRRAAIEAIDNLDDARAVPAVSRALKDNDPEVRRAAADALGSMDDRDAVPALMAVAKDADNEVRKAVISALSSLSDKRALPTFVTALGDADPEVRNSAADAFTSLDNLRNAPPELIRAMEDRNAEVRHSVAHALGHIRDPEAVKALIAHVTDPNVEVRQAVVESLDEFDDPAVTTALRTALKDSDADVRQSAAKALGNRNRSK